MYFRNDATEHPERIAVRMAADGSVISYRDLEARANQLARLLRRQGLERGDHIAILMENSLRFFEVMAAASRIGLYYTPISAHLTPGEVAYIVENSRARVVFTSAALAAVATAAASSCPHVEHWYLVDGEPSGPLESYSAAIVGESPDPLPDERLGMALMYSSGTTGRPKGIVRPLPEEAPADSLAAVRMGRGLMKLRAGMTLLVPAPLYHAAPHAAAAASLQLGATMVVMDRFAPEETLRLVQSHRITHVQMVPTMFVRLLKLSKEIRSGYDLSSLEAVVHSAAPCPIAVKEQMIEWLGPIVYEYYGATESYGFTRCTTEEWLAHKGTVGRSVLGEIHIIDDDGVECPTGEVGNVWFTGGSSFSYLDGDDLPRPSGSTVGDVGYVDVDGYLYLTDRKTFMIVSGGVNIYPQEVENALLECDEVIDAAVFGIPHEDFGEQVKAVVVLAAGCPQTPELEERLIARCRASLASFKCPRSIDVVESLPRLESGKLAKHLIRSRYLGDPPATSTEGPRPAIRGVG